MDILIDGQIIKLIYECSIKHIFVKTIILINDYTEIRINLFMYNHINLKTDKLIYLKTYIIINENTKLHLNKYTNCQQL